MGLPHTLTPFQTPSDIAAHSYSSELGCNTRYGPWTGVALFSRRKKKRCCTNAIAVLNRIPKFFLVYITFIEMCVHKNCNIRSAVIQSLKGDLRTSAAPTTVCRRSSNVPGIHRTLCTYLLMDALAINRRVQIAVVLEIRCSYK